MAVTLTTSYQRIGSATVGSTAYGTNYVYLYAKYNSQNVANRTTTIDVYMSFYAPVWIQFYSSSQTLTGAVYNATTNATNTTFQAGETTLILASSTITHNADGTKTISLGGTFTNSYFGNTVTVPEVSCILPTIPVKTYCPPISGNVESYKNIAISPASSSFKHSLHIQFGNLGRYVNASGNLQTTEYKFSSNNIPFNIPATYYNQFTGASGTGTATLRTYSGNTLLGSTTNTVTISASTTTCKPVITATVVDSNPTTIALTNNENNLIYGVSNALITTSIRPSSANDPVATINYKYVTNSLGQNIDFTSSNTYTDMASTKKTFYIYARNSRGTNFYNSYNASITGQLIPYVKPALTSYLFKRNTEVGTGMKLSFSGNVFTGYFDIDNNNNQNTITVKWYVRKSETDNWTLGGTLVENTDYTIDSTNQTITTPSEISLTNPLTETEVGTGEWYYRQKYYFKIEITDLIYTSSNPAIFDQYVKIGEPVFNWYKDSSGTNHFNINGELTLNDMELPNYIKVKATSNQTISTAGVLAVNFDTVVYKRGNAFQLYNNKVQVISDKVHHVKATATIWVERYGNSYALSYLTLNGNQQVQYMVDKTPSGTDPWASVTLTTIMAVTENDYIYPNVYFNAANSNNGVRGGTYSNAVQMIVEVLD